MKRFLLTYPLLALLAGLLVFSSCSKDKDPIPAKPNNPEQPNNPGTGAFGGMTWGGKSYALTLSEAEVDSTDNYSYTLACAPGIGGNVTGIAVYLSERPTENKDYVLGETNFVTIVARDSATNATQISVYNTAGEKVKATIASGKVTLSFTDLTETNINGGTPAKPRKLTATMKEK